MSSNSGFYGRLTEQLIESSTRAIFGLKGFRSHALRDHLRESLGSKPGVEGSVLADLVFEAAFGWEPSDVTLDELAGTLLHGEIVNALANPVNADLSEDYTFPRSRYPYAHQLEAWRSLIEPDSARSVLVSSGEMDPTTWTA